MTLEVRVEREAARNLRDHYLDVFTIRGSVVHVLHIRHQAQDPSEV